MDHVGKEVDILSGTRRPPNGNRKTPNRAQGTRWLWKIAARLARGTGLHGTTLAYERETSQAPIFPAR